MNVAGWESFASSEKAPYYCKRIVNVANFFSLLHGPKKSPTSYSLENLTDLYLTIPDYNLTEYTMMNLIKFFGELF